MKLLIRHVINNILQLRSNKCSTKAGLAKTRLLKSLLKMKVLHFMIPYWGDLVTTDRPNYNIIGPLLP